MSNTSYPAACGVLTYRKDCRLDHRFRSARPQLHTLGRLGRGSADGAGRGAAVALLQQEFRDVVAGGDGGGGG